MQGIGTKIVFVVFVLLAALAVASVMNTPEFQHVRIATPGWF